jgi:hypothetical protein
MIEIIKYLIIVPLAADFIADRSGIMEQIKFMLFYRVYSKRTKYKPYRIKPFDCTMCMSFWLCLFLVIFSGDTNNYLLPFAAACVGALLNRF